jgi:hypothetical protein
MTGKGGVIGPFFPTGADPIKNLSPIPNPFGQGSPATKVHVIRVRADDQNPLPFSFFDVLFFQYTLYLPQ